ncbi:MAG TPA: hypothetical protein VF092_07675 [Longimicrobium sp.]
MDDDLRAEYDFTDEQLQSAERGKYADRVRHVNVVRLDPDVAELFPDSDAVNRALRALGAIIREREQQRAA